MKKEQVTLQFEKYDSLNLLNDEDKNLLLAAREATKTAYAPYSHYHVGAAVLLQNGTIVSGSNQENAAYPSGLCAERVAVFAAGAHYPDIKIKAIAISARAGNSPEFKEVSPCGDCRQVMAEYEYRYRNNIRLIMQGPGEQIIVLQNVKTLLPFMFSADNF